jgi:RNA polymerase sigma-70 factor (ECF subfamily)
MSDQLATDVAALFVQVHPAEGTAPVDVAFAHFYALAFPRVYAFIRSQVADASIAQDIVGRVFLKAFCNRHKAPPADEGAISWVFRIACTTVIDYWRVEGRRGTANVPIEELEDIGNTDNDPEASCSRRERHAILLRVISTLDADDRALLALKFAAQRTNREIARILGLKEGAVSMRLLRALRRLKKRLRAMGVS